MVVEVLNNKIVLKSNGFSPIKNTLAVVIHLIFLFVYGVPMVSLQPTSHP